MSNKTVRITRTGIEVNNLTSEVGDVSDEIATLTNSVNSLSTTASQLTLKRATLTGNVNVLASEIAELQDNDVSVTVTDSNVSVSSNSQSIPLATRADIDALSNLIASINSTGGGRLDLERTVLDQHEYFEKAIIDQDTARIDFPIVLQTEIPVSIEINDDAYIDELLRVESSNIYRLDSNLNVTFDTNVPIYANAFPTTVGATFHAPGTYALRNETTTSRYPDYAIEVLKIYRSYVDAISNSIQYFAIRGLSPAPPDYDTRFDNVFANSTESRRILMKFIEDEASNTVTGLQLWCALTPYSGEIQTIRPDNFDDVKFAPITLPVTTDNDVFTTSVENEDNIVLYESDGFIHIRVFNKGHINEMQNRQPTYLTKFIGSFVLMKRNERSDLTRATYKDLDFFMQCSNYVFIDEQPIEGLSDYSAILTLKSSSSKYIGLILAAFGNGSSNFDFYFKAPYSEFNGTAISMWTGKLNNGDNPYTKGVETVARESVFTALGFPGSPGSDFSAQPAYLGRSQFLNPPSPESVYLNGLNAIDIKPGLFNDYTAGLYSVSLAAHEYVHNYQIGIGSNRLSLTNSEGQAVAVELDTALTDGLVFYFRALAFASYVYPLIRGKYTLGERKNVRASNSSPEDPDIVYPDYGSGLFDHWLAATYDNEYQIMRRVNELLTITVDLNTSGIANGTTRPYRLALKQALLDLNKTAVDGNPLTIERVLADYAIMVSLLRTNQEIPKEYRCSIPLHIWTQKIRDDMAETYNCSISGGGFDMWWELFDKNIPITRQNWAVTTGGHWRDEHEGETMRPTWPSGENSIDVKLADTAMKVWSIDAYNHSEVSLSSISGRYAMFVSMFDPVTGTFLVDKLEDITSGSINLTQFRNDNNAPVQLGLVAINIDEEDGGLSNVSNWAELDITPTYIEVDDPSANTVIRTDPFTGAEVLTHVDRRTEIVGIRRPEACYDWTHYCTLTLTPNVTVP